VTAAAALTHAEVLDAWCGGACDAAHAGLNVAVGVLALGYDGDPTLD